MDDVYILREIAGCDKELWKLFSMLNWEMNKYFNVKGYEYELKFRTIWKNVKFICYQLDGKEHRSDGPAVIYSGGSEVWCFNGKLHRLDGPADISPGFDGGPEWWVNNKRHRIDGPAVIKNNYRSHKDIYIGETEADEARGDKEWWVNGKRHRSDGPAVEFITMPHRNEWWINGKRRKDKEDEKERIRMDKILHDKRERYTTYGNI